MSTSIPGEPWSTGVARGADGAVTVAGDDVRAFADEHGTPAYVLDETDLRTRARGYRRAFETAFAEIGAGVDVYYAGKAFLSVAVARWVHEEGLRVDTATGGELAVALRAGIPGADIGLHGNNKSDAEIARALDAGVGRIIVDSLVEIERVADAASVEHPAPVMVRVTTGVHAGGHEYISTAHEDQKFGLSIASPHGDSPAMQGLLAVLARPELRLLGIHSHIGSQILDPSGFEVAARAVLTLRAQLAERTGVLVDEVDLGGGYGIAYLPGEVALDPDRIAKDVAASVQATATDLGTPLPRFSIEPGRAIVGPAGLTLYTVGTVKPVRIDDGTVRTYVSIDGGMSDNIRPALYGASYHAEVVGRLSDARDGAGARRRQALRERRHRRARGPAARRRPRRGPARRRGDGGVRAVDGVQLQPRAATAGRRRRGRRYPRLVRRETEDDLLALDLG